ncbi:MAG: hypothetical protein R6U44_03300 [Archaeoglobaceae archaeon]
MRSLKLELARKSIHFMGVGYIPLYLYAGRDITLFAVLTLTLAAVLLEAGKFKFDIIPHWLLREHELKGIGSHLYTGGAISIITLWLPMGACFAGIANGIVGDGISGLVKKYNSLIALPIMFLASSVTLLVVSIFTELSYYAILFSCLGGVIAESVSTIRGHYLNDNFSVPIVSSVIYKLVPI